MSVSWTRHRFSGGRLALDTANTVVLRIDPARRFDRFDDPAEIARFAEAASDLRSAELGGRALRVEHAEENAPIVLAIREATDRLFRGAVLSGALDTSDLAAFAQACGRGLAVEHTLMGQPGRPFGDPFKPLAFETALAVSALALLGSNERQRIRICGHCGWLFLDTSRNRSRIWCDMAVCGNREKAKRHYRRNATLEAEHA